MRTLSAIGLLCIGSLVPVGATAQMLDYGPVDGHELEPIDLERVAVGTEAPDFTLPQFRGEDFTLSSRRGEKNVVLVFYRGWWCPYCVAQLKEMRTLLDDELKMDTELIVVSIDDEVGNSRAFQRIAREDGMEPDFPFLSDPESAVIGRYGVLNPDGGRRGAIPHPSIYVIDKEGIVRWKENSTNYRMRPSSEEILTALAEVR